MKFHCMFEQSGTFKREFQKLGYEAIDYDILNDYGETANGFTQPEIKAIRAKYALTDEQVVEIFLKNEF